MMIKPIGDYFNNGKNIPQGQPGRPRMRGERSDCGALVIRPRDERAIKGYTVYFVSAGTGPIKVGITNNVTTRMSGLQVGSPRNITIEASIAAEDRADARGMELFLHRYLKKLGLHIRGEWFELKPALIRQAVAACIQSFGDRSHFIA